MYLFVFSLHMRSMGDRYSNSPCTQPSLHLPLCSCCVLCVCPTCTTGLKTSHSDACLFGAFLLVQELWSCSNWAQPFLCVGGAVLQRAVLVNSVSCREAMLLGRIMEEAEEAIYVILSLSLSLVLVLLHPYVLSFISFSFSHCHAACLAFLWYLAELIAGESSVIIRVVCPPLDLQADILGFTTFLSRSSPPFLCVSLFFSCN